MVDTDWKTLRAELPADMQALLDEKRQRRECSQARNSGDDKARCADSESGAR